MTTFVSIQPPPPRTSTREADTPSISQSELQDRIHASLERHANISSGIVDSLDEGLITHVVGTLTRTNEPDLKETSLNDLAGGVTSIASGILQIHSIKDDLKTSHELHTHDSYFNSFFKLFRGLFEFEKGGTSIASSTAELASKTLGGLAIASTIGTSGSFAALAGYEMAKLKDLHTMQSELKQTTSFNELKSLAEVDQVKLSPRDKKELREIKEKKAEGATSKFLFRLKDKFFSDEKSKLFHDLKEYFSNPAQAQDPQEIGKKEAELLNRYNKLYDGALSPDRLRDAFDHLALEILKLRKEKRFKDAFGEKVFEKTKSDPISAEEQLAILSLAKKNLKTALIKTYFIAVLGVLAATATILAEIFSASVIPSIVEFALTTIFTLGYIFCECIHLSKTFTDKNISLKQKILMVLHSLGTGLVTLVSVLLLKIGFISAKPFIPIIALGLWIMTSLALFLCSKKDPQKVLKTPDHLENTLNMLLDGQHVSEEAVHDSLRRLDLDKVYTPDEMQQISRRFGRLTSEDSDDEFFDASSEVDSEEGLHEEAL